MSRVKTFDATGIAPGGRLYAGDLNSIQDQYADLVNYSQNHGVASLAVGDASIQLLKYGTGEARLTGLLRTDGILRGLGGLFAGQFTTAQRDAIGSGFRPYGLMILNTTENELQWNAGDDAMPEWMSVAMRGDGLHAGGAIMGSSGAVGDDVLMVQVTGDTEARWIAEAGGALRWSSGAAVPDVELKRNEVGEMELLGRLIGNRAAGQQVFGARDPADTIHRWWVGSDGSQEWGPGGAGARDVRLYRSAADVLKLDDGFEAKSLRTDGNETQMSRFGPTGHEFHSFRMRSLSINPPALNAFSGSGPTNYVLPAGSGKAGDHISYEGTFNDLMRYYTVTLRPQMPLDDRVQITWFNTDNQARDPGASTMHFHIWNHM